MMSLPNYLADWGKRIFQNTSYSPDTYSHGTGSGIRKISRKKKRARQRMVRESRRRNRS